MARDPMWFVDVQAIRELMAEKSAKLSQLDARMSWNGKRHGGARTQLEFLLNGEQEKTHRSFLRAIARGLGVEIERIGRPEQPYDSPEERWPAKHYAAIIEQELTHKGFGAALLPEQIVAILDFDGWHHALGMSDLNSGVLQNTAEQAGNDGEALTKWRQRFARGAAEMLCALFGPYVTGQRDDEPRAVTALTRAFQEAANVVLQCRNSLRDERFAAVDTDDSERRRARIDAEKRHLVEEPNKSWELRASEAAAEAIAPRPADRERDLCAVARRLEEGAERYRLARQGCVSKLSEVRAELRRLRRSRTTARRG